MITAGVYLLKVIACSGLLAGYYFLALRNKTFHQWNRFYLLFAVVLSLLVPLLQFTVFHTPEESQQVAIQILKAVNAPAEPVLIESLESGFNSTAWLLYLYGFISLFFLCLMLAAVVKIYRLINSHASQSIQNISFIPTTAPGTPFSFLHFIFWNTAIDLNTAAGSQIFKHELVHVRERHTWDKLFMQFVISLFWCNPFFWIIRYELQMIHEFIADKKAVHQQDATQLAALILQTAYPKNFAHLINPFFQQSIKRRLAMLTQIKNPRINYISRLLFLPLLALIVLAFTVQTKTIAPQATTLSLNKKFVVAIDAGHGGNDPGAIADGLSEKDITLAIAKQIEALNQNKNLEIVLTRTSDETVSLPNRTKIISEAGADLLLSIHINAAPLNAGVTITEKQNASGFEITIPADTAFYGLESKRLGSAVLQAIRPVYKTATHLKNSKTRLFLFEQRACPAIILECGYLTNGQDVKFIKQATNQKMIAQKILAGIEMYAASVSGKEKTNTDTLPKGISKKDISEINVLADKRIELKLKNGSTYISDEAQLRRSGIVTDAVENVQLAKPENKTTPMNLSGTVDINGMDTAKQPLLVINGEVYPYNALNAITGKDIASIDVLKDATAIAKWGSQGKNGVISIKLKTGADAPDKKGPFTKPANETIEFSSDSVIVSPEGDLNIHAPKINTDYQQTFTKVEIEPQFPGGSNAWSKFLEKNLNSQTAEKNKAPKGTYTAIAQFIVEKDGSISEIKAVTKHGFGMEEEVVRVLKGGPKWTPAKQNGHIVRAYKTQEVTFVVTSETDTKK